jgi:hypothetical protein
MSAVAIFGTVYCGVSFGAVGVTSTLANTSVARAIQILEAVGLKSDLAYKQCPGRTRR